MKLARDFPIRVRSNVVLDFVNLAVIIIVFLISILAFLIITKMRFKGKLVAFFIEKDKTISHHLFKPTSRSFTTKNKDYKYMIDTDRVTLIEYPFGLPSFLRQTLPCLIYPMDNPEPLDPKTLTLLPSGLTAKEVAAATREEVVANIVKSTREEGKEKIPAWMISAGLGVLIIILAVLVWGMSAKIDDIAARL